MPALEPRTGPALDVNQVAGLLDCSTALVYRLCERGALPHYRSSSNAIQFEATALGRSLGLGELWRKLRTS